MKDYRFLQRKYSVNTYPDRGLTFVKGEGPYLIDESDEHYLDLMTNYGVNIFGYNHPTIVNRLKHQVEHLTTLHGSFNNDVRALAAKVLVNRCGGGVSRVYLSNSGAEAIEAALKFAVLATGKKKFICCRNNYHGKTLGALSASDNKKYKAPFEPLLWDFHPIEFNDLQQLENTIDDQVGAFLVEPIQGEGGINVPDSDYIRRAKQICEANGVLMILDEIQTGMGRTGFFLASHMDKMSYDLVCLGKGLAGGIPVGATLVSEEIASKISKTIHTSTFGGNPLAGAGILATLELLDDALLSRVLKIGSHFLKVLRQIPSDLITQIRGQGLMLGIELAMKRDEVLKNLQKEKILAIPAADKVVRFLPPYILEEKHVDKIADALERIFKTL